MTGELRTEVRQPVIAGNWKMYKTIAQAVDFVEKLKPVAARAHHCEVVIAPPFTALAAAAQAAKGSEIRIAAQDVHWENEGAYTGDVSAVMLVEAGATHVIIGHSERRQHHGETDNYVNWKLKAALVAGLTPIVCVGETLAEREAAQTPQVLARQFAGGLAGLTLTEFSRILIAYEPVWAIGTGKNATPQQAQDVHAFVRKQLAAMFDGTVARRVRIQYGGSVKASNARELMSQPEVDGALVGGASLEDRGFSDIIKNSI